MTRSLAYPLLGALFALAAGGTCNEQAPTDATSSAPSPSREVPMRTDPAAIAAATADELPPGFHFELREGDPEAGPPLSRPAPAEPLDATATDGLLTRLPPIASEEGDVVDFALREASKPPPLTGETITTPFPPPPTPDLPPEIDAGPPEVLRYQPEGEVPLAPRISVTFSKPMVPVTSHDTLAKSEVPARLTPEIDGKWRWVGTRTLFFDPVGRAPMATDFTVEIPAGVKDATGQPLKAPASWTFHTPPPNLLRSGPSGSSVDLDPVLFAVFDQRIDAEAVLSRVEAQVAGRPVKVRLADAEQRASLPVDVRDNADIEGRWLAFTFTERLKPDSAVRVTFPKGLPSAEGPRTTEEAQSFHFRTYGPMRMSRAQCGWGGNCVPGMPLNFYFTNNIDEAHFDPAFVTVSPEPPGLRVEASGSTISIRAITKGETTYKVTVSDALRDTFGQPLDKAATFDWKVGPSDSRLIANLKAMQLLDPAARQRRLPVYVMNMDQVEVELYKVKPKDWVAYLEWRNNRFHRTDPPKAPGSLAFRGMVATGAPKEELTEVGIDLAPALNGDFGHVIAVIKPTGIKDEWRIRSMTTATWVQVTQLGLDAFSDHEALHAWVTDLGTGAGVGDVSLSLQPTGQSGRSDARGLARLALPASHSGRQQIVATHGEDVAFLPDGDSSWGHGSWVQQSTSDTARFFVYDDRALYRPDETVSVKGVIRIIEAGKKGDVTGLPAGALTELRYTIRDSRNNDLTAGTVPVSASGTFHLQYHLPKTPNLGEATIRFHAPLKGVTNTSYTHRFDIQEFRRPEFEVSARASEGPHIVGQSATATVNASYFAGGPLPGAEVRWAVGVSGGSFTPPNHSDFVFGTWTPWWIFRGPAGDSTIPSSQRLEAVTDASGTHILGLDFKSVSPPRPTVIRAEGTVMDVNRQAWSSTATFLVHPSRAYVGLRTERHFVEAGKPITVDVVAADLDGQRIEGAKITVRASRFEWRRVKGNYEEVEEDPETCTLTSGKEPGTCTFRPKAGGRHRVVATIADAEGRRNETSLSIWVPGGTQPAKRNLEKDELTVIPSKRSYEVGETAEFLVQAPFSPAEGVYLVRRGGIVSEHAFRIDGDTATIKVPIEEWMIPGWSLSVHLNGSAPREADGGGPSDDLPRRPAFAATQLSIGVPPTLRRLTVEVSPREPRVEPGGETEIDVAVTGPDGRPVEGAEVTLVVVDESVLALSGYTLRDPIRAFYTSRTDTTRVADSRSWVLLAKLDELMGEVDLDAEGDMMALEEAEPMPMAAGGGAPRRAKMMARPSPAPRAESAPGAPPPPAEASGPIAVRSNFDPLALFKPDAVTDAKGRLSAKVKMPDNLTRYRVMAVAVSGANRFGTGESSITARLPLMVRMSAPRFLNFGDRFELPVVLQNQTDADFEAHVAVRATNAAVTDGAGRKVLVPANDRVEVRFPMAAERPGTARFQAGAVAMGWSDAAEVSLPVWTPATTEAFATYGEIDKGGIRQPVKLPEEVVRVFGGLEVQTSSTQLQALTDAVVYLVSYPYECSEQIASRVLSIAALKDVLGAFKAEGLPAERDLISRVDRDIERLRGLQGHDGGFAFWRRDQQSWPFVTVHVTHALIRAKEKGFSVPDAMLSQAMRYLVRIRSHMNLPWYTEEVKRTIESYALYLRARTGDIDASRARALISEAGGLDKAGLGVIAWLYPVLSRAKAEADLVPIRRHLNNRVTETAGAANFVSDFGDGAWLILHSSRRIDGLLLEGLIDDQPRSDLIPKVVRGLLAHRQRGHWGSTQENAWVLLGLDRYFHVFEGVTPNFLARAWLGDQFAGEHRFKGRTTERHQIDIPMRQLVDLGGEGDLVLTKDGPGRLYYRVGMRYAPKSLELKPSNHGFHVERLYEGVDDPADVTRHDDDTWSVKAGARVKVTVTMHSDSRRYHVALVDPLPAGFEALNPALRGTQSTPVADDRGSRGASARGRGYHFWWRGPWYEHQNLRDERAEAFTSLLYEGVYTFTYFARATTPGEFVVPPAKAEEMYAPETFGRSASTKVTVR